VRDDVERDRAASGRLLNESLNLSEKEALAAFRRRWASTRYCQDMAELLARLEGELNREGTGGPRGVSVIVIRGEGAIIARGVPAERRGADGAGGPSKAEE
jgi:hypothetical protein